MYILLIVLIVNGQFNSFTDIKFQEFSTESNCMIAKEKMEQLFTDGVGKLKIDCVKK